VRTLETLRGASAGLTLLFLALLATSGWALMAGYVPSDAEAFSSVLYMEQGANGTAFLRAVHHHLASGAVVGGFLYLVTTYLAGRHSETARLWWWGCAGYVLLLGICFCGYLLPMDQKAYWGTVVRLGIIETMPLAGRTIANLLRGGETINASTLPRFYTLHAAVLPALLLLVGQPLLRSAMHHLRRRGRVAAWLGGGLVALVAVYAIAAVWPAPLEIRADPTDSVYAPRPEWYFLWLFQFGKYVEAAPWVQSLLLPVGGLALLAALPLLSSRRMRSRLAVAGAWCAAWIALTALAAHADRDLPPKLQYEPAMRLQAETHYADLCADCHGEDGRGRGPQAAVFALEVRDFTDPDIWREIPLVEMKRAIRDGKGKDMPKFGHELALEEVDALMQFIQTSFAPTGEPAS